MCFNETVSFIAGSFGVACSLYLLHRGRKTNSKQDKFDAVLVFVISLMQFIEYVLWKHPTCDKTNQFVSTLIPVLFLLQILAINAASHFIYKSGILTSARMCIIAIEVVLLGFMIKVSHDNRTEICSMKDKGSCRLAWGPMRYVADNYFYVFIVGFVLYLYLCRALPDTTTFLRGHLLSLSLLFALLYSAYYKGKHLITIFGGLWCFLAVAYGPVAILRL